MKPLPFDDPRIGDTHNRALCCECGTGRLFAKTAGLRNPVTRAVSDAEIAEHRPLRPHLWEGKRAWERWLADFKCATCGCVTRHALLRDCSPEYRDWEETDPRGAELTIAAPDTITDRDWGADLRQEIRRLEGFGVRFEWRRCGAHHEPTTIEVEQALFDLSWTITLNESMPEYILHETLLNVWPSISDRGRCEKIRWRINKSARRADFTYLDPWVTQYVDLVASDLLPRAVSWARAQGGIA